MEFILAQSFDMTWVMKNLMRPFINLPYCVREVANFRAIDVSSAAIAVWPGTERYHFLNVMHCKWAVLFSFFDSRLIAPLIKLYFLLLVIFVCRFVRGVIFCSALF